MNFLSLCGYEMNLPVQSHDLSGHESDHDECLDDLHGEFLNEYLSVRV